VTFASEYPLWLIGLLVALIFGAHHHSALQLAWLTTLLSICANWAFAEPGDVLRPYISYGVSYDDNLLRVNSAADAAALFGSSQTSDIINSETIGIIGDKQISLQHFNVQLELTRNEFNRFTSLDNDSHYYSGVWNWQFGQHVGGDIGVSDMRKLGTFLEVHQLVHNEHTYAHEFADIAWQFHPSWRVRAAISTDEYINSLSTFANNNRNQDMSEFGLDYLAASGSSIGLQYSQTDGTYPARAQTPGSIFDTEFKQQEVSTVVDWLVSGKTHLQFKAAMLSRLYNQHPSRNFNGPNGRVTLGWTPTGKLNLSLATWREIYADEEATSNYVDGRGISLTPTWAITSKIKLQGKLSYEQQDHVGDPLIPSTQPQRHDVFQSANAQVSYEPLRNITLIASIEHDERLSNLSQLRFRDNTMLLHANYEF
jgi:exopolysaccharide biosynthesis operon protein EpsL